MAEFAIGAGVLALAFLGTFEFGYQLFQYNRLQNAVAAGAQYAALATYDSATFTPTSAFQTAVKNVVLYAKPTAGTSPLIPGLAASNISLTVTFDNGVPAQMKVAVSGYTIDAVFATISLTNKPQVTYPYEGIWQPI